MSGRRDSTLYWICQTLGWGSLAVGNWLLANLQPPRHPAIFAGIFTWAALSGVVLSHRWRGFLRGRGWLDGAIPWPRVAVGLVLLGAVQTASVTLAYAVLRPQSITLRDLSWLPSAVLIW